ncbi:redox-regulated ATPase YchF [bacterium]|nr:redox-regulated ATPase YchF [bacterium]
MTLSIGIVGLPNVGKSTLFNAITNACVDAQNYPFCTIEPNSGIVPVPDVRIETLSKISGTEKLIYATIEFVDIAGLVKGASKGEGLGNKFLANIRETSAIAHVVRCFNDDNIIHVHGKVDPISDIETIELELILADLDVAQKAMDNQQKRTKTNQKEEVKKLDLLKRVVDALSQNTPVRAVEFDDDDAITIRQYQFLTAKPVIYVGNVDEDHLDGTGLDAVQKLRDYAKATRSECIVICAKLESELATMSAAEKKEFLGELGINESGLDQLSRACFNLLGLQTYLTTGVKETRAWTIRIGDTAPKAAGVIHTDFEKGFIRANIVDYTTFVECGGWKVAKEKGLVRQEGKEYVMKDGDVVEFLFNV